MLVTALDLDKEPRAVVAGNKEINLLLPLVANIIEREVAVSKVRPELDRLQKMAGDERLGPFPGILDQRSVVNTKTDTCPLW